MPGMSGAVVAVAIGVLILLVADAAFVAGTRRRPPRHGSVQLGAPEAPSTKRAARHACNPEQS
jgi:uncharacterized iron-regulated membrane protein